jgi:glycosyltransferase involved in cell wall biosynthesis
MSKEREQKRIKIAVLTGGKNVPSARFRIRQYIPALKCHGIDTIEFTSFFGSYPPNSSKIVRPFWGTATLLQRIPQIVATQKHHVTLLQREMLSTFMTLERFSKRPRILDVDDAIWLNRKGLGPRIARACDGIICGNSFLADHFLKWNYRVYILPTAIDTHRFSPINASDDSIADKKIVIVWSGTSSGLPFLYSIEDALNKVLRHSNKIKLRIISDKKPNFTKISPDSVEFLNWNYKKEVSGIQTADIGIMPLWDNDWNRGKCSFKMLAYLSCGLPAIVSPIGMNNEILRKAELGFGAKSLSQWTDALMCLISNAKLRKSMGINGRNVVNMEYSISAIVPQLSRIIRLFC